ncbi:MAG: PD-(D/E)XK nuclease family protein [Candidatus Azambacteria bacterium]|nr:PD-(D/E)XK nuclease family protein [Candidatus Azambacteria bacterium]
MTQDKYTAIWVSHSSMGDFLKCPRAYYLRNVYKDPKTGRKINIVNPALSLGQAVHTTLESLKNIPFNKRTKCDLLADFEQAWAKVSGKMGGFKNEMEESEAKIRGRVMVERVIKNPGPIAQKIIRLKESHNGMPPNFFLSDEENIILCGLIDWLEYVEQDDSIRILDFKTGKHDEGGDSLQLPIYLLLLNALQNRKVSGASYWYLDRNDKPVDMILPDIDEARKKVLAIALQVKVAREKKTFNCPRGDRGCFACKPFEAILKGGAEYLGVGDRGQDMYFL